MRKLLALLISATLMLSLVACGDSGNTGETNGQNQDISQGAQSETNDNNVQAEDVGENSANSEYSPVEVSITENGSETQIYVTSDDIPEFISEINKNTEGSKLELYFRDDGPMFFVSSNGNELYARLEYADYRLSSLNFDSGLEFNISNDNKSFVFTTKGHELNLFEYNADVYGYIGSRDTMIVLGREIMISESAETEATAGDHKFVGEYYLERPDYFGLAQNSDESFFTVEADKVSFVHNGQSFTIDYIIPENKLNSPEIEIVNGTYNDLNISVSLHYDFVTLIIGSDYKVYLNESLYQTYLTDEGLADDRFAN